MLGETGGSTTLTPEPYRVPYKQKTELESFHCLYQSVWLVPLWRWRSNIFTGVLFMTAVKFRQLFFDRCHCQKSLFCTFRKENITMTADQKIAPYWKTNLKMFKILKVSIDLSKKEFLVSSTRVIFSEEPARKSTAP